jgi:ribosomal protein S18 acetylase RimI-like enzyme
MNVGYSNLNDFDAWISLSREVEPLFGPMADEIAFQEAIRKAISEHRAFCMRSDQIEKGNSLKGGIIVSKESNEIVWLAISRQHRGLGFGRQLLEFAVGNLNPQESIFVQTFDESTPEGKAARKLYLEFGFTDIKDSGLNPAGVPTVIMELTAR